MINSSLQKSDDSLAIEKLRTELTKIEPTRHKRIVEKFFLAALGSIPWIGGFMSTLATYKTEEGSLKQNTLQNQWLEEHQKKLLLLQETLENIQTRLDTLGTAAIEDRLQSEEYLKLVRQGFRTWDKATTAEKRKYIANIITNSVATRACSDDILRLFIDWIELYHEAHFSVIREIFQNPGSTRYHIWSNLYGEQPNEDSSEADLFKLLIRDLSTGSVIRQERDVNQLGQFVKKRPQGHHRTTPLTVLKSAFDNTEAYVLTNLGKQFVHYTMSEAVTRISASYAN